MNPKKHQLFIDGKPSIRRGLDLACNPFNGKVVGDVTLVSESLLNRKDDGEEVTVRLFCEDLAFPAKLNKALGSS